MALNILALEAVDSTNLEARRRADAGETGPLWITAKVQTAGRGRRGRSWSTGPGDLAATLLTLTTRPPADAAQVSFVMALAVHELVASFAPASLVKLKWPNDVLLAGGKVSGILIDSGRAASGAGLWLAIGVGVNLAGAPAEVERPASALADHLAGQALAPPTPEAALERLDAASARWMSVWDQQGFAAIAAAWSQRAQGLGAPCQVRLDHEQFTGVAEALEHDGALRVRLADGQVRRVTAGDVFPLEG